MTNCSYTSYKHSHSAFFHCALLEMLGFFNLYVVLEHSNAPTNNSPIVLLIATSPMHRAKQAYSRGDNLVVWRQYIMYNGSIFSE